MKAIIPAFGVTFASAVILGGSLYLAVHGESANAGPVIENPVAQETSASAQTAVIAPKHHSVFDESPAADPVRDDTTADALLWKAHAIPTDRTKVRTVGPRFYPDPANSIDLHRTGF